MLGGTALATTSTQGFGATQSFDYAWLKGQARALAAKAYQPPRNTLPKAVESLDYDQYQSIRFRGDHALWRDDKLRFKVHFAHLGMFFKTPVHLYQVADGKAQEIAYLSEMFDHSKSGLDHTRLPKDLGFAGFKVLFHTDPERDVTAFLGASYFRAVGGDWQFGLSARGLAIDTGMGRPEEFPNFVAFWLEKPQPQSSTMVVYALLDSPSVAGAYRFAITPGDTQVMDIDSALYPRKSIERLGIAPCTSMFQHGENDRRMANDWRPEIHDSDGLSLWRGNGEWVWRPLANPANLRFNAYGDDNPRGFGLLQRDRDFTNYQDDGVFYEKRPSLWVEPKAGWGAGSVQLVEIPTVDETFDNVVAFWNPAKKPQPGEELLFAYRLYWGAEPPARSPLARCVATRTGIGGIVGQPRKYFSQRFVIDFAGGDLPLMQPRARLQPVISVSRGKVDVASAWLQESTRSCRVLFDIVPPADTESIDLRLYVSYDGQPLTETWLYQWTPPPMSERRFA
jgi:glucans biosynthesis protein